MTDRLGPMMRQIQREAHGELSDGQLLALFGRQGQCAAFEELVRRHGAMVFGVCRRVAGNHHDAEDAFQATFWVLARKAKADQIGRPDALVGWLYGVAYNVARKAKAKGVRRREKESGAVARQEHRSASEEAAREWREVLDAELNRLPTRYRALLIQCDFEGKTMQEAADLLGRPVGTVKGQLSRAREMLRKRLVKRGLTTAASALAGWLAEEAASAAPAALVAATVKGIAAWAAGEATAAGAFSVSVVALTEEMMRSLLMSKIKFMVAVLAAVLVLGSAGGYFAWAGKPGPPSPTQQGTPPAPGDDKPGAGGAAEPRPDDEPKEFEVELLKMKPLAADPKDDELRKLLKERFNAALQEVQALYQLVEAGKANVDSLADAGRRLVHAGLEVYDDPKEQVALLQKYVALAKEAERIVDLRQQVGRVGVDEMHRARYFRADAEITLLRLKRDKPK
jgi:RNA polymerase sigma factor (sigma-70 family)